MTTEEHLIQFLQENDEIKLENEDNLLEIHGFGSRYIDQDCPYMTDSGYGFDSADEAISYAIRYFGGIGNIETFDFC